MRRFFDWCRRYISIMSIIVVGFLIYTLFIQDNSIFKYMEYQSTIDSLTTRIEMAKDTMEYYHKMNSLLSTDNETMERVVREQYNMARDGEDIYVFE